VSVGDTTIRPHGPSIGSVGSAPVTRNEQTAAGVLDGIRVVEFAQNIAVPTCGRALAAMGADVIKVEPPHGDATRSMAPFEGTTEGRAYAITNPGKRGVVLDLTDPASFPARDALLRSADIVLVAFKGADLVRYGLTYDEVGALNPTVIFLEHRAFGSEGPDADQGGYDVLVQGLSGLSFVTSRSENGRPVTVRPAYSDMATGLASTAAVLGALYHRQRTGEGQRVRTSLLGTALYLALPITARFDAHDEEPLREFHEDLTLMRGAGATFDEQRALFESRVLPAGGAFEIWFRHYVTADAMMSVGALSPMLIDRFHTVTGLPDPRKQRWTYHSPEWNALIAQAEELMASDTTESWMTKLRAGGVPCSRYNIPTEALDDPGAVANGFVHDLDHPLLGRYRTAATPIEMEKTPVRTSGPSPMLGEHTASVLAELGFTDAEIAALHVSGVTRPL
jgi:crotonobetainyl-CoA:carnitine CoA-transferase CaiB-like acyl-CoA transferase